MEIVLLILLIICVVLLLFISFKISQNKVDNSTEVIQNQIHQNRLELSQALKDNRMELSDALAKLNQTFFFNRPRLETKNVVLKNFYFSSFF